MPTTPVYAFPYPALTDSPNGPTQIQALAEAVDDEIVRVDADVAAVVADVAAIDALVVVTDTEATDETGFTSTSFTGGGTPCGIAFTAPPSGIVVVLFHCRAESNTIGVSVHTSVAIREGVTVGSGTVVSAATDEQGLQSQTDASGGANQRSAAGTFRVISGLTAGNSYNAQVEFRMATAGNGDIFDRSVAVIPSL